MAEAALAGDAQQQREMYITTTFGEQVWLDCRLVRFDAGGEPHLLLLFDDITERKQAENSPDSPAEARYRALFENMLNGYAYRKMLFDGRRASARFYLSGCEQGL